MSSAVLGEPGTVPNRVKFKAAAPWKFKRTTCSIGLCFVVVVVVVTIISKTVDHIYQLKVDVRYIKQLARIGLKFLLVGLIEHIRKSEKGVTCSRKE